MVFRSFQCYFLDLWEVGRATSCGGFSVVVSFSTDLKDYSYVLRSLLQSN